MPALFPDILALVLCALIVAGAQLIYATVGFGAGMFSIALVALVLPELTGAVAALFVLTFVTEVSVLLRAWRQARGGLLLSLLPMTVVGMWLGTELLVLGDVSFLKRVLGLVVLAAGMWFLYEQRRRGLLNMGAGASAGTIADSVPPPRRGYGWWSVPAGLAAGTLAGLFGTGGPPVIIFLRAYRLDKSAFRATLLWYFLIMSLVRGLTYWHAGLLSLDVILAAAWLLPASLVGMLMGMALHRWLSERAFTVVVSALLVVLGVILLIGGGR